MPPAAARLTGPGALCPVLSAPDRFVRQQRGRTDTVIPLVDIARVEQTASQSLALAQEGEAVTFRGLLYRLARLLGDVSAARRGRIGRRIARRAAGRATGRLLRRLFR